MIAAPDCIPHLPGETLDIGHAWAGHPVGFALLTTDDLQFVAYYDQERMLTVVSRELGSSQWQSIQLPEQVGWDSHNGIVLGRDSAGHLHLSGNMHADPLVYFRTGEPDRIETFERASMTGVQEDLVTYPEFFQGPGGALCFGYRHGSSGKGDQVYNRYDVQQQRWERLVSGALVSGEGERNAYLDGPHLGPDGYFHLCWVWRDTPDCATNHDVCYARSRDLVHWETSGGDPLPLPIVQGTAEVVDPVQPGQGLMNGNTRLGFDHEGRAIITYHKLDPAGATQVFNARREDDGWRIYQVTDWEGAWLPAGTGSIIFELRVRPVVVSGNDQLTQRVWSAQRGEIKWELDPVDLRPTRELPGRSSQLGGLSQSTREEMGVRWSSDSGDRPPAPFALRWETLPENRDHAHAATAPAPSILQVVRMGPED